MKIKDLPKSDRPREKLVAKGVENLKDSELLAILLRTGSEGVNVVELARKILKKIPYYVCNRLRLSIFLVDQKGVVEKYDHRKLKAVQKNNG